MTYIKKKSLKQEKRTAKEFGLIHLSNGGVSKVDLEDVPKLSKYSWRVSSRGYVVSKIKGKQTLMHRFILGLTDPSIQGDHIDRDPLNNQKSNLRVCNQSFNNANRAKYKSTSSIYKGVRPSGNKWRALGIYNGVHYNLGTFNSEIEAGRAYDIFMLNHYGDFALTNGISDSIIPVKYISSNTYRGITYNKSKDRWQVRLTVNGVRKQVGLAKSINEAVKIYNDFITKNNLIHKYNLLEV